MRYVFPARLTLRGDERLAARFIGEARAFMGALMHDLGEGNVRSGKRSKRIGGVVIDVQFDGTLASMRITAPVNPAQEPAFATEAAIWIPRGFVVYPASDDSPGGWGLPVVQDTSGGQTPYDAVNLAPGLDVSRWTENGGRGQVLVTDIVGAGYPADESLLAPLAYHRAFGPRLADDYVHEAETTELAAYRLELTGYNEVQSLTPDEDERLRMRTFKRGIYERVNEHRISEDLLPVEMPIRGFYDSAQVTAEISFSTSILGHYAAQYPVTYRTPDDRMTRDGLHDFNAVYAVPNSRNANIGEIIIANAAVPPVVIGTDPDGTDIYQITVNGAELTAGDAFDAWLDSPTHKAVIEDVDWNASGASVTCLNVGQRHNYAAGHFQRSDQWISCGNRKFACPDGLAPISWFGFPTMNLAWETWPCLIINTDVTNPVEPLIAGFAVNDDTEAWVSFYATADAEHRQPAMSRVVYSAGRSIAYAPGLVWAAGVHKLDDGVYRLVVLTHNEADQPSDKQFNGMTAKLRVWYCDIGSIVNGALSPAVMIRGIYGDEDEGWPWDQVNNPCSWRGGELIDVSSLDGSSTNLLKYRSQWVFNSTATQAICLRDQGMFRGESPTIQGFALYPFNTTVGTFSDGLYAATVKLDFAHSESAVVTTYSTTPFVDGEGELPVPPPNEFLFEHIAVDYDDDDVPLYASRCNGFTIGSSIVGATDPPSIASLSAYYGAGIGPHGVSPAVDAANFIYLTPDGGGAIPRMWSAVHVLDVKRAIFITERPPEGDGCYIDTTDPALQVELFVGGAGQGAVLVPNPTLNWVRVSACYQITGIGSVFRRTAIMSTAAVVQGFFAEYGTEFVAGFNVLPQRNLCRRIVTWPSANPECNGVECLPTSLDLDNNTAFVDFAHMQHLGSFVASSFATAEQLRELVGAEGAGFRLLSARTV